ncbi:MAG: hypothetical protein QM802_22540 [Agriterribacter sp.]
MEKGCIEMRPDQNPYPMKDRPKSTKLYPLNIPIKNVLNGRINKALSPADYGFIPLHWIRVSQRKKS